MKSQKRTASDRHGEKGAALVISILIATLLLAVAGTVILTSGMSATTSIESTAELQAYYAAESGLEAALNVLRGHVQPKGIPNPNAVKMGFRNAVDRAKSNRANDNSSTARLSAWLDYDDEGRVTPAGANYSYSVIVTDPDDPTGSIRAADATYKPKRIQVQSTGFGPKGAVKNMEMIVQKTEFDFEPKAMLTMRGADDGSASVMSFDIGNSAAKYYTGHDNAGTGVALPTFGVTNNADLGIANDAITKGATVADVKTAKLGTLPSWLQSADAARAFLNDFQLVARSLGRYYTSFSGMAGTVAEPKVTFVDGNASIDGGAGLLIVTGDLVLSGNPSFNGIILVIGEGTINRNGGGNGNILGTIYVAKFARSWPASENGQPHPFLAPSFHTNGGGNADLRYDSEWVQRAKNTLGDIVRDVREY